MTKKTRREIEQQLEEVSNIVMQEFPYTVARVTVKWGNAYYEDTGFSKCHPNDQWDDCLGKKIAQGRAISGIARQIEGEFYVEDAGPTLAEVAA